MIGKVKPQTNLFDVGNVFDVQLRAGSFHAQLAEAAPRLFSDEQFAKLYAENRGRPSVPPSQLALTLLLQRYEDLSDEAAIEHTAYDLRWAAVLGRPAGTPFCAKSTLQLFRAHLLLHDNIKLVFHTSIKEAKRTGLLKGELAIAIDTKPILGRGAVKDTYNLLADGITLLAAQLAKETGQTLQEYLTRTGLERYIASSIKGSTDIDWSDDTDKQALLTQIVADAKELLERAAYGSDAVRKSAELLCSLLLQDIEESADPPTGDTPNARIKEGTASGRIPSTTDPEQRHGRKSQSKRFNGHKASVATDIESQIIVAADVLAGDAPDNQGALEMVKEAEENTDLTVIETQGDCAYGDGGTRQKFADVGRTLNAKVPKDANRGERFPKSAFTIDLQSNQVSCPGGKTTTRFHEEKDGGRIFSFGSACAGCPLRAQCTSNAQGRTIRVHPQEDLIQQARAYQQSEAGRAHLRERVVVEHSLARLSHLGIGQARYFGRLKTRFQLLITCSVANLRRTWNWVAAQSASQAQLAAA
jgi:transposase